MIIWDRLGIEPTDNVRIIKKAYAKKAKECHQEDYPEEWQLLHDAYEQALAFAKRDIPPQIRVEKFQIRNRNQKGIKKEQIETKKGAEQKDISPGKPIRIKTEYIRENEIYLEQENEYDWEFERINQQEEYLRNRIEYVSNMETLKEIQKMSSKRQLQAWKDFIFSERVARLYRHPDLWKEIMLALGYYKYHKSVYQNLPQYFESIRHMNLDMSSQIIGMINRICFYCDKLKNGNKNQEITYQSRMGKTKSKNSGKQFLVLVILAILATFFRVCVSMSI